MLLIQLGEQWWGVQLYLTQRIGLPNLYATFEAVLIGGMFPYTMSLKSFP